MLFRSGNHIIKTSLLGYESSIYDLNLTANTNDICIEMNEMAYGIDQVVVTASRTERNLKDVPVAVQIISGKNIEKMQLSTMRDLLEYELPGVEFKNNGGYANINMLGFGGKYVLFLVDGERLAGESFDNIDYNRINLDNIERIEIIKGASSSLYGSNAVGGVINIITKKPDSPFSTSLSGRIGSFNEQNYNFNISTKQKFYSFNLNASYTTKDSYLFNDRSPMSLEYDNGTVEEQSLQVTYVAVYTAYNIAPSFSF